MIPNNYRNWSNYENNHGGHRGRGRGRNFQNYQRNRSPSPFRQERYLEENRRRDDWRSESPRYYNRQNQYNDRNRFDNSPPRYGYQRESRSPSPRYRYPMDYNEQYRGNSSNRYSESPRDHRPPSPAYSSRSSQGSRDRRFNQEPMHGFSEYFHPPGERRRPISSTIFNGEPRYYGKVIHRERFDPDRHVPPQDFDRNFRRELREEILETERRIEDNIRVQANRHLDALFGRGGFRRGWAPRRGRMRWGRQMAERRELERPNPAAQPPNRKWMNAVGPTENDPPFFSNLPESR